MAKVYQSKRKHVFISYSHADTEWLRRLKRHLKPLEREGAIYFWSDSVIKPGSKWREEIRNAVEKAKVAILLINADFLASDFIDKDELYIDSKFDKEQRRILTSDLYKGFFGPSASSAWVVDFSDGFCCYGYVRAVR